MSVTRTGPQGEPPPSTEPTVADLSEDQLLSRFAPLLPQGGALVPTGDDAAVLALTDPRVVVTTDALVEGAHFRREWSTGADVGWRAIMQNAPDVAAMGAAPVGFVVSLVMPGDLPVSWVVGLATGMAEACREITHLTGRACGVVGGDLAGGPTVVVSVTA
ncbi:MAG TPA: thiamine-phosphate kinase, partial [Actinomycetales bacterium]|nr:thiamine-phosphate kinase [Actinomycetales bacterium]